MNNSDLYFILHEAPSPDLAENKKRTEHWSVRDSEAGPLRASACAEARDQFGAAFEPIAHEIALDVLIIWEQGRKHQDFDSACISLKPVIDGLDDASIFVNDSQIQSMRIAQAFSDEPVGRVFMRISGAWDRSHLIESWIRNLEMLNREALPESMRIDQKKH